MFDLFYVLGMLFNTWDINRKGIQSKIVYLFFDNGADVTKKTHINSHSIHTLNWAENISKQKLKSKRRIVGKRVAFWKQLGKAQQIDWLIVVCFTRSWQCLSFSLEVEWNKVEISMVLHHLRIGYQNKICYRIFVNLFGNVCNC